MQINRLEQEKKNQKDNFQNKEILYNRLLIKESPLFWYSYDIFCSSSIIQ